MLDATWETRVDPRELTYHAKIKVPLLGTLPELAKLILSDYENILQLPLPELLHVILLPMLLS
jgi:hypothetical protein